MDPDHGSLTFFFEWPILSKRMATIFPKGGSFSIRLLKFLEWLGDMTPFFFLLSGLKLTISALNRPLNTLDFYRKRLFSIYLLCISIQEIIMIEAKFTFKKNIHFF